MNTCVRLPGGNRVISHVSVCEGSIDESISDSACHLLYIYKETFLNLKLERFIPAVVV